MSEYAQLVLGGGIIAVAVVFAVGVMRAQGRAIDQAREDRAEQIRSLSDQLASQSIRVAYLESENRICMVIQSRLIRVVRDNGLEIPDGTFDAPEVFRDGR